jgi:hypothetical protein
MSKLFAIKSYYDADQGRLVELEDDVLSIVSQVREAYGDRIAINLDPITGWFHFTEHCEDGAERLIFSTGTLDGRSLERLLQADSQSRGYQDSYDAAEAEQDRLTEEIDARHRQQLGEPLERLMRAMKQDGLAPRFPLVRPVQRGKRA